MDILTDQAVPTQSVPTNHILEAYRRWLPTAMAIPEEDLIPKFNVNVPSLVVMVRGAQKSLQPLKARCPKTLPEEDLAVFDVHESQVLALAYAQGLHLAATKPTQPIQEVSADAVQSIDILTSGIQFAIKRGLLPGTILGQLLGTSGYKNQATDLVTLAAMYRDNEKLLEGRTGVTKQDIDEAEALAYQLFGAIGEREQQPTTAVATAKIRQRIYTLFMRTHDALRRIVTHLRWSEGDADKVLPSAHAGRQRGKSDLAPDEEDKDTETEAEAVGAQRQAPATVNFGAHAVPTNGGGARAGEEQFDPRVGMPGSNPFTE
jgi:hypothetical protein